MYAVCEAFHGAIADVHNFFTDLSGLAPASFADHLLAEYEDGAVSHLFRVAAGLDSAVVGESEILGQVRLAFDAAKAESATGPRLDALFRQALETGKRARTETAISQGTASISQAAVDLAQATLGGSLANRSVLVLGTGEIGVSMATSLRHAGVARLLVANRTRQKAAGLAARIGGITVALHELPSALAEVDVLLTATSSSGIVLERFDIEAVLGAREGRSLLIVDTAMPRDVDPSVASLDGVTLFDLDAIKRFVEQGLEGRRGEIDKVEAIVADEVERYLVGVSARIVAPVVVALRERFEDVRLSEFRRRESRLVGFTEAQRHELDVFTKQLLAKLLHEPISALKSNAGSPKGDRLVDSVRDLFDL